MYINKLVKYPRTPHLPWSPGRTNDDEYLVNMDNFKSLTNDIIVTEKLDGECTSMYEDKIHARSLDSKSHPSRNWIKKLHSEQCFNIPSNMRIVGENVYGKHSIYYDKLDSYFYVFAIFIDDVCVSWDDTVTHSKILGFKTVPVLYKGPYDEQKIKDCWTGTSTFGNEQEGYVIRNSEQFCFDEFNKNVAKFVRINHIQTDEFWLSKWYKGININELINHLEINKNEILKNKEN